MLVDRRCIGPVNARTPLATGPLRTGGFVSRIGHRGAGHRAAVERLHSTAPVRVRCACCAGRIRISRHTMRCGPVPRGLVFSRRPAARRKTLLLIKYLSLFRVSRIFGILTGIPDDLTAVARVINQTLTYMCNMRSGMLSRDTPHAASRGTPCSIRRTDVVSDLVETQAP